MFRVVLLLIFLTEFALSGPTSQPLGYAGNYLTTSVGIGQPPQFFDLAISFSSDKFFVLDRSTSDPDLDYKYNYVKSLYLPEASETVNMTRDFCKERYKISSSIYTAQGVYAHDLITLGGQQYDNLVRFCDLNAERTTSTSSNDPLNWLMKLPVDGFFGLKPGGENAFEKAITRDTAEISLFINNKSTESDNAGTITFGGKDNDNCKNFFTFPSEDSDSLTTWISKMSFNFQNYQGYYSAVFNTRNDTLVVPYDVYQGISNYFDGQMTYFYCTNYQDPPDLLLTLYGHDFKLSIKNQIIVYSGSYCQVNIGCASSSDEHQLVISRAILDNYCLYFDYQEALIGLSEKSR
ncbi:hypothetical protein M3Y96_00589300 [Aphelenchoides besseyi]|nr:hypothetical protein M3Y96_00589300 [Aphelenchoides besseyi]